MKKMWVFFSKGNKIMWQMAAACLSGTNSIILKFKEHLYTSKTLLSVKMQTSKVHLDTERSWRQASLNINLPRMICDYFLLFLKNHFLQPWHQSSISMKRLWCRLNGVRSCRSSTFISCTPILIWSLLKSLQFGQF